MILKCYTLVFIQRPKIDLCSTYIFDTQEILNESPVSNYHILWEACQNAKNLSVPFFTLNHQWFSGLDCQIFHKFATHKPQNFWVGIYFQISCMIFMYVQISPSSSISDYSNSQKSDVTDKSSSEVKTIFRSLISLSKALGPRFLKVR